MPYTHTVEDRILRIAWHGVVAETDLRAFREEMPGIVAKLGYMPDLLHTFDRLERYSFAPITVYMVSLLRKRVQLPRPARSAIVATTPETRSLSKVFKALNRTRNLEIEIFESEVAALRWLRPEVSLPR